MFPCSTDDESRECNSIDWIQDHIMIMSAYFDTVGIDKASNYLCTAHGLLNKCYPNELNCDYSLDSSLNHCYAHLTEQCRYIHTYL